jgi:hypothetical protein
MQLQQQQHHDLWMVLATQQVCAVPLVQCKSTEHWWLLFLVVLMAYVNMLVCLQSELMQAVCCYVCTAWSWDVSLGINAAGSCILPASCVCLDALHCLCSASSSLHRMADLCKTRTASLFL